MGIKGDKKDYSHTWRMLKIITTTMCNLLPQIDIAEIERTCGGNTENCCKTWLEKLERPEGSVEYCPDSCEHKYIGGVAICANIGYRKLERDFRTDRHIKICKED